MVFVEMFPVSHKNFDILYQRSSDSVAYLFENHQPSNLKMKYIQVNFWPYQQVHLVPQKPIFAVRTLMSDSRIANNSFNTI
jgi:hypothetical protein